MSELKSCPFCGRKQLECKSLDNLRSSLKGLWMIECKCGAKIIAKGKELTVKLWTRRE